MEANLFVDIRPRTPAKKKGAGNERACLWGEFAKEQGEEEKKMLLLIMAVCWSVVRWFVHSPFVALFHFREIHGIYY